MPELLQNNQSISFDIEANEADKKIEIKQEKSFKDIFKNKTNFQAPKNAQDVYNLLNTFVESLNPVKPKEKATFFRLLSVMINAGIPIVESLNTLSLQTTNPHLKKVILNMSDDIKNGQRFSSAMEKHPDVFDETATGMIEAGEFSGRLNSILQDIATDTENSASLKAKIKGALTYPIVVLFILGGAIILLMTMVVPQITSLFSGADMELPAATKIMIFMSDFLKAHFLITIISPVAFFLFIKILNKTPVGKFYLDKIMLILPVFGELTKKASLSRFSRMLSNLIKSGISIVEALEMTANAVGNEVYKRKILLSARDTAQGIPLGENLKGNESLFPSMIVSMIAIGEKTGEIATVLDKVASFYDDEVDIITKNFSKLIEPLILVVVGLTVGGIVAAIMQPIISLTDIADKI